MKKLVLIFCVVIAIIIIVRVFNWWLLSGGKGEEVESTFKFKLFKKWYKIHILYREAHMFHMLNDIKFLNSIDYENIEDFLTKSKYFELSLKQREDIFQSLKYCYKHYKQSKV